MGKDGSMSHCCGIKLELQLAVNNLEEAENKALSVENQKALNPLLK